MSELPPLRPQHGFDVTRVTPEKKNRILAMKPDEAQEFLGACIIDQKMFAQVFSGEVELSSIAAEQITRDHNLRNLFATAGVKGDSDEQLKIISAQIDYLELEMKAVEAMAEGNPLKAMRILGLVGPKDTEIKQAGRGVRGFVGRLFGGGGK